MIALKLKNDQRLSTSQSMMNTMKCNFTRIFKSYLTFRETKSDDDNAYFNDAKRKTPKTNFLSRGEGVGGGKGVNSKKLEDRDNYYDDNDDNHFKPISSQSDNNNEALKKSMADVGYSYDQNGKADPNSHFMQLDNSDEEIDEESFSKLDYNLAKEVVRIMEHLKRTRKAIKKERDTIRDKIEQVKELHTEATDFHRTAVDTVSTFTSNNFEKGINILYFS